MKLTKQEKARRQKAKKNNRLMQHEKQEIRQRMNRAYSLIALMPEDYEGQLRWLENLN